MKPSLCIICGEQIPPLSKSTKYCSVPCYTDGQRMLSAVRDGWDQSKGEASPTTQMALWRLRRANILHLLDLKRAGHSPSRTELRMKKVG